MKHARYAVIAILAVSFGAAAAPNENRDAVKWEKAKQNYITLLTDANPGVKASAANYIRKYNITEAAGALQEALNCDNCETVKIAAALALIKVAGSDGMKIIKDALQNEQNEMVVTFYRSILHDDPDHFSAPVSAQ